VLFKPEYGTFDLAVGSSIVSAYAGSADFRSFDNLHHVSDTKTIKVEKDSTTLELENLYKEVRDMRADNSYSDTKTEAIFNTLKNNHTEDWLLTLELLELVSSEQNINLKDKLSNRLTEIKNNRTDITHLIESGLQLLN
jgi:phenylalanine-4-hydroxylase